MTESDLPTFYVDFNELVEPDLVLLSKNDLKSDINGREFRLSEGMEINVSDYNEYDNGNLEHLFATGIIEVNSHNDWSSNVKWCCRINNNGIRDVIERT